MCTAIPKIFYTEEKFNQVKSYSTASGETEEDSRWAKRVTDVRQWAPSARKNAGGKRTNRERRPSGKSGGQKGLPHYPRLRHRLPVWRLEWGRSRDRSRFVVIDDTFGRGR